MPLKSWDEMTPEEQDRAEWLMNQLFDPDSELYQFWEFDEYMYLTGWLAEDELSDDD